MKLPKNVFGFEYNWAWPSCVNFSQLWQEHLWSAVNMPQNGPKTSDPTKRHDTQLNFVDINGKSA